MNFKMLLLTTISTLTIGTISAQDKLYKKRGGVLDVKVTEINRDLIMYKKSDNIDGPTYKIDKRDVDRVEYENGTEENFSPVTREENVTKRKAVKYGNNIISVMPMQITSGVGVGLAYERVLDKEGILSFYMPATVAFNDNTIDPVTGTTTTGNTQPTYYIMPGVKFYPTGGKGVVRYAVGPNLAYVTGNDYVNELLYDNAGNVVGQDIGWRKRSALGIMITNSLNINPTAHIHMGLELGLGFTYFNKVANRTVNTDFLGQFGFKIGYRF